MNADHSWSRCANEFASLVNTVDDDIPSAGELDDLQICSRRRINSNNVLSSRKSVVATDVALANIEEIEPKELVSRWIAREICTPPASNQNPDSQSVDIFSELKTSPVIRCKPKSFGRRDDGSTREKSCNFSPDLTRSPIIGNARFGRIKRRRFNSSEKIKAGRCKRSPPIKLQFDKPLISKDNCDSLRKPESGTKWDSEISSLAYQYFELGDLSVVENKGAARFGSRVLSQDFFDEDEGNKSPPLFDEEEKICSISPCDQRNLEQRFLFVDVNRSPSPQSNTEDVLSSVIFEAVLNKEGHLRGFRESHDASKGKLLRRFVDTQLSQDLFDENADETNFKLIPDDENQLQGESTSIREETGLVFAYREGIDRLKTEDDNEEEILGDLSSHRTGKNNEYLPEIKAETDSCKLELASVRSLDSFIPDTEELLPHSPQQIPREFIRGTLDSSYLAKQKNKFLILDSELHPEKNKFVTDTERIDYDTSSENEEDNPDVEVANISNLVASDSDRTVSDIIEEPLTQDYIEPSKSAGLATSLLQNSISALSSKISETVSSNERLSIDTSVETTQPSIQESSAALPELILSTKKKKLRGKKGSLGARLRKLVSGQVSYIRLWRYQISRDSVFQQSSTPWITLLITESWFQYEKNFYLSQVLEDPDSSLNDYFSSIKGEKNGEKNLVVMINPEFVGTTVKMLPSTIFKVYSPWKIFNHNTRQGYLVLHALYFKTMSIQSKEKVNFTESGTARYSLKNKLIHEYDCPCLQTGKIDDSCSVKFTNQKLNAMDVILNEK